MSSPALPASPTGQLAASIPGFDPQVINAGEQQLADFLAMPTQQLLGQMGLPQVPSPVLATPANPGGAINPLDPAHLISPVVQALSTLGTGQFLPNMDPTSMLNGISNAFDGTSGPLQQALGAVGQGWQGASNAAATAKMGTALANGAEVAAQASGLQSSLAAAVADVGQAQTQLIAIINEYTATVTASIPFLPFSLPAIVAAAAQAVTQAAQVMTQTQSSLAAQASAVSAIGTPVNVTSAPQLGTSGAGALGSLGSLLGLGSSGSSAASSGMSPMSALSAAAPLMYLGSAGMSPIMSAVSAAGRAGNPAATDPATATLADATAPDPNAGAAAAAFGSGAAAPVAHVGGGGAATAPSAAPVPRITAPTIPAEAPMLSAPTRPAMAGGPMGGAGMMGAPLAGAGQAGAAAGGGGAHTAASFLHTSDQGGKVVGGRSTVAPPVLGAPDPYDIPDIELRI